VPTPRSARECLARGQIQSVRGGPVAGREFLKRTHLRQVGRDPEVNDKVSPAQVEAIGKWASSKRVHDYLKTIKQPTLVVNGSNDVNIPTATPSSCMQNIPYAELINLSRLQSRRAPPVPGALR